VQEAGRRGAGGEGSEQQYQLSEGLSLSNGKGLEKWSHLKPGNECDGEGRGCIVWPGMGTSLRRAGVTETVRHLGSSSVVSRAQSRASGAGGAPSTFWGVNKKKI
jgi:hypothetical protein